MKHPKPIIIIDYAVNGMANRIAELQRHIQLVERFGSKAMIEVELFKPEESERMAQYFKVEEMQKQIDDLTELAVELKTARNKYFDKIFDEGVEGFIKEMRKNKKP